jgi:DNA repair exonuclease SbcCD nuclease subunit
MKILFFADTQADVYHDGFTDMENKENTRFTDCLDIFGKVRVDAEKKDCQFVIFGGDLHEQRNPSQFVRNKVNEEIKNQAELNPNIKWILIPGNHDQDSKSSLSDDSLRTLTIFNSAIPNVEVVHDYKKMKFSEEKIAMYCFAYGWMNKETFDKVVENIQKNHKDDTIILIFHENIGGCKLQNGMELKSAEITIQDLEKLAELVNHKLIVLAGHIHKQQFLSKNFLGGYVGCPLQITKDDEGENKGWWIIDVKNSKLECVPSDSPMIKTFEFMGISELIDHNFEIDEITGNIVRIYIHGDREEFKTFDTEKFKVKLYKKYKIRALKIQRLPSLFEKEIIEIPSIIKSQSIYDDMQGYVYSPVIPNIPGVLSSDLIAVGNEIVEEAK